MTKLRRLDPDLDRENCKRKNHGDWHHAMQAAARMNKRQTRRGGLVAAPYICPVCSGVHVGNLPGQDRRRGFKQEKQKALTPDLPAGRIRCLADALEFDA